MTKPMKKMLLWVAVLFGIIIAYKVFVAIMTKKYLSSMKEIATVTTTRIGYQDWQPQIEAAGSLRATKGVDVTTELAGLVQKIYFQPGSKVKEGEVLVQLNADSDVAQWHALQATAELAKTVYKRDKSQYAIGAISKAVLDTDAATLKSDNAQAEQQAAIVAKKTIRAPFAGKLGVSAVNPGQYLNPGNKVVSLQTLDPIYVDFYVPQQSLIALNVGQTVHMTANAYPGKVFVGKITTIDPALDPNTRNVEVEATIANEKEELIPGMFTTVKVDTGASQRYLTLPQTAIAFNPYGNIVYVVKPQTAKDKKTKPVLIVTQAFVDTGAVRGDQIAILHGLNVGDEVVTSGQVKLKNGSEIKINNSVVPSDNPAPQVTNERN